MSSGLPDVDAGAAVGGFLEYRADETRASSITFSPDGARIVSGSWDETLRLWLAFPDTRF